jgi:hypothetical protein
MFAKHFNIKIIGALPETYANISPNFHISPTVMANVNFYETHLGIKLENNYGGYDITTTNNLENNVINQ